MRDRIAKPLPRRTPWLPVARAYGRAALAGRRLPPGRLVDVGELERARRTTLIDLAARHGPVFKGLMDRRLVVCVVGTALGRRVLKEHAAALRPVAIRLESLFPHGFMRAMAPDVHRQYRKALVGALGTIDLDAFDPLFEAIARDALARHARCAADAEPGENAMPATDPAIAIPSERGDAPIAWADTLAGIAAGTLVALFFGTRPGEALHARLLDGYRRLGPHGVVWNVTDRQVAAYRALRDLLATSPAPADGVLGRLRAQGGVDETMLGNLIYMVELGRYDVRGLLRWISRYAADYPAGLERVALEASSPGPRSPYTQAFVRETLRMDQSERLMRDVLHDFEFERWRIPGGALLRVCLWESHKDAGVFARPFSFDPERFLSGAPAPGTDGFSPFGLDHHHCPLAGASSRVAEAFLRVLATDYELDGRAAEPAVRGPYHWEPSPAFDVTLRRRAHSGH